MNRINGGEAKRGGGIFNRAKNMIVGLFSKKIEFIADTEDVLSTEQIADLARRGQNKWYDQVRQMMKRGWSFRRARRRASRYNTRLVPDIGVRTFGTFSPVKPLCGQSVGLARWEEMKAA